jgi:hypothetical protein
MSRKYRTGLSTVSQSYGPPQPTKADAYPQADRWSPFEKTGVIATTVNPRFLPPIKNKIGVSSFATAGIV